MKHKLDYRQVLRTRAAEHALHAPEHKPLDSLGYRNKKALNAWRERRAKHGQNHTVVIPFA